MDNLLLMLAPLFSSKLLLVLFFGTLFGLILGAVSYTHLRAHETSQDLVCRLLLEKKLPRSFFLTLSSFVVFVVVSKTLDFFLAISALSIFVSYCWGEKRIFYLLLVGIIFPIIVFIFFETILGLRFPPGIITNIYYS